MSEIYDKETDKIETKVGNEFSIELESSPGAGYEWQEDYNDQQIELLDKKFDNSTRAVGASGKEILTFKTLQKGQSVINLRYKRIWENESAEDVKIKLQISED